MNYQEKMTHHLQAAEALMKQVDAIEQDAEAKVQYTSNQRLRAVALRRALEDDVLYHQLSGARNYHVTMATMYGIAALVEQISVTHVTETL